ncbi:ERI1 exoribonuclease 2 [Chanos chanos]|uniref:ERI1 exoribonuclease 2 n=1 Tax=Chanos chanos TaxID=29144 RepID=A0A6J2VSV9_CHACN|nr:ERI1 exoribonuclease 2 [Chanos chanos]
MSTKKLARELGLIRQRSRSSSGQKHPQKRTKQFYSYLIVIDFESTCWREKNTYGQEIIEFPAVLLNTSSGEIESEFHTYVQPQEHPVLSGFCTELTGISQTQVEGGVPLHICLSRFSRWLQQLEREKGVVFMTHISTTTPPRNPCAFVTWSDWDLGVCLLNECKRKQIYKPEVLNSWVDLRATYRTFYSRQPRGLNGALQDLGIEFSGRQHSGLDDARNTARLALRMMLDGCVMKLTKTLCRTALRRQPGDGNVPVPRRRGGDPDGKRGVADPAECGRRHKQTWDSLNYKLLALSNTPDSYSVTPPGHHAFQPEPEGTVRSEVILLTEVDESGSYDDVVLDDASASCSLESGDVSFPESGDVSFPESGDVSFPESGDVSFPESGDVSFPERGDVSFPESGDVSFPESGDVSFPESGDVSFPERGDVSFPERGDVSFPETGDVSFPETGDVSFPESGDVSFPESGDVSKTDKQALSFAETSISRTDPYRSVMCPELYRTTTTSASFTVYTDKSPLSTTAGSRLCSGVSAVDRSRSPPPSSVHSVPKISSGTRPSLCENRRVKQAGGGRRVTSPLCACGQRARRRTVGNGGPNHGRVFFCCPVPKRGAERGPKTGCDFFKWESTLLRSSPAPGLKNPTRLR